MKMKIFFLAVTLLPLFVFAGNDDKEKEKKEIDIHIKFDKKGTVEVSGLDSELKELQDNINKALENVTIKVDDGKKKHDIHIKAEIKIK